MKHRAQTIGGEAMKRNILTATAITVLMYLMFAFVQAEFNPFVWHWLDRMMFIIWDGFSVATAVSYNQIFGELK
jgi:hypothetical protein